MKTQKLLRSSSISRNEAPGRHSSRWMIKSSIAYESHCNSLYLDVKQSRKHTTVLAFYALKMTARSFYTSTDSETAFEVSTLGYTASLCMLVSMLPVMLNSIRFKSCRKYHKYSYAIFIVRCQSSGKHMFWYGG